MNATGPAPFSICLTLPDVSGEAAVLLRVDASGRVLSRQRITTVQPFPAADGDIHVLAIPGNLVRSTWLTLDAVSEAQAAAAARTLLAGQLATVGDDTHVVLAPRINDGKRRQAMLIEGRCLQHWLDTARAWGIEPDVVLPDYMLLSANPRLASTDGAADDAMHVVEWNGKYLVHGAEQAFSCEAGLLLEIVGEQAANNASHDEDDSLIAAGVPGNTVNLLQHRFARKGSHPAPGATWRRIGILAAAVLLSPLLLTGVQATRYAMATAAMETEAATIADGVLGDFPVDTSPVMAMRSAAVRDSNGVALTQIITPLFATIASIPGMRIERLEQNEAGIVSATLLHTDTADLDHLQAQLDIRGLRFETGDTQQEAGRHVTRIVVSKGEAP